MIWALAGLLLLALILLPQLWVRRVMLRHSQDRPDLAGTGGELARHLLDVANLQAVAVEQTDLGDHYDPAHRKVRLTPLVLHGRSLTAVAVAAHEVGHALQHADGSPLLPLRSRLARLMIMLERTAAVLLLLTPVVALIARAPPLMVLQLALAVGLLVLPILLHLVTLPLELDASFGRALPILERGKYLEAQDLPAARSVLRAAAWTYVAAALISILNVARLARAFR